MGTHGAVFIMWQWLENPIHFFEKVGRNVPGRNVFLGEMLHLIFLTKK